MTEFNGMNRETGLEITGFSHIEQSIMDILSTRIGTRVMRRDYGSVIPDLIDRPLNDQGLMKMMVASVIAIMAWEPRIKLTKILLDTNDLTGKLNLNCEGIVLKDQQPFSFERDLI